MTTLTNESPTGSPTSGSRFLRAPWLIAGGLAIAAAGVTAGMAYRSGPAQPSPVETTPAVDEKVAPQKPATSVQRGTKQNAPVAHASQDTTPLETRPAAVCTTCGVVEGVREVQKKGEATGLGAIAGGVVGGALGNQVGKGDGRKAMTVIGAIGGGVAGHEIEKQARADTFYEVRVRMDDGSVRTLMQKMAPTPGSRVTVEGNTLRSSRAPQGESGMVRTSSGT